MEISLDKFLSTVFKKRYKKPHSTRRASKEEVFDRTAFQLLQVFIIKLVKLAHVLIDMHGRSLLKWVAF